MGIFDIFFDDENEKKKKKQKEIEKEMDYLGLDDWEKEEVRKNGWDPEDFNDDELEEGDYYYDE